MDREQIIRMAREAGFQFPNDYDLTEPTNRLERFAKLVADAEREKLAAWMIERGYATGHGDSTEGLLKELEWQIEESVRNEREACAKACGAVQCEPQEAVTEDGWCDWVCPKPQGYLMQCCDCELIHEVDFRVVRYESEESEVYEVVDDPNLQAQMRLRRRDDLSPKRKWQGLTEDEINKLRHLVDWTASWSYERFAHELEQALKEKNHG